MPRVDTLGCLSVHDAVDDGFGFWLQPPGLAGDVCPTLERSRHAAEHPFPQHFPCCMLKPLRCFPLGLDVLLPLVEAAHHALFEQHAHGALGLLRLADLICPMRKASRCMRVHDAVDDGFGFSLQPPGLAGDVCPTLERSRHAAEHPPL